MTIQTTRNAINYDLTYTADGGTCFTTTGSSGKTYEVDNSAGQQIFTVNDPSSGGATLTALNASALLPFITTVVPNVDYSSYSVQDAAGNSYTLKPLDSLGNSFQLTSGMPDRDKRAKVTGKS